MKIFHREAKEYPSFPMAEYIELLNNAIRYKQNHPSEDVTVNFALYQLYESVYFYYDPADAEYGNITPNSIPGRTENIFHSVIRAAKNKVNISFTYQSKGLLNQVFADSSAETGDHLKVYPITWGTQGRQQMHCKYMTINKMEDAEGEVFLDSVYVSSQNIDQLSGENLFKASSDRANSGVLVSSHPALKNAYDHYFQVITENCDDQNAFQNEVKKLHAAGTLNYEDEHFGTFFTPVIGDIEGDGWDIQNNMVARYVTELEKARGNKLFYADVYIYYSDAFGLRLYDELMKAKKSGKMDVKWAMEGNACDQKAYGSASKFKEAMEQLGPLAYEKLDHKSKIHCKDYIFSYKEKKTTRYITISGSANLVRSEMNEKANASIVIKETEEDHRIFDVFKSFVDMKFSD